MAQAAREREIDLRFHVHLQNTRQFVFDRFLDRDDAARYRIDRAQIAIQRCRFSAAGRAGKQNDSVRLRQKMADRLLLLLAHVQPVESELLPAAAEQSQADRFAVHGRNGRNANVDLLITCLQIHAPVLGQAPFGNVHVRHHFQS